MYEKTFKVMKEDFRNEIERNFPSLRLEFEDLLTVNRIVQSGRILEREYLDYRLNEMAKDGWELDTFHPKQRNNYFPSILIFSRNLH